MTSTTYVDKVGPAIAAAWLNDANTATYKAQSALAGSTDRTAISKFSDRVSLKDYAATGDGVATGQNLKFDTALANLAAGGTLHIPDGTYLWSAASTINKACKITGNATIKVAAGFVVASNNKHVFNVTAADVTFDGITFDDSAGPASTNDNVFVWTTAANTSFLGCKALSLHSTGSNLNCAFAGSSAAPDMLVALCRFDNCPGAGFSQGLRALFSTNIITSPLDVSFAFNSVNSIFGKAIGNQIYKGSGADSGHILAEEGASQWSFIGNTIFGMKDGTGIGAVSPSVTTIVQGGTIADNILDGGAQIAVNPSSLISVSQYYRNTQILNNRLRGMASGLASNTAITAPLLGTKIAGNFVDCTAGTTSGGAVVLTPAGGDCYFFDNEVDCTTGPSRHIVVQNGSNSGAKLHVKGGRMIGGTSGIDFNLNSPTNMVLWIENMSECTATNPVAVSTAYAAFGDRQVYFNTYGAVGWPHSIKGKTVMYGNAAPTAGTFATGDEVIQLSPSGAAVDRWRCTAGGTPGTWKAGAVLAA